MMHTAEERNQLKEGSKNIASSIREAKQEVDREAEEAGRQVQDKMREGKEKLKQAAGKLDRQIRQDPWPVVTGIAVGSLLIGFVLGSSRR